MDSGFAKTGQHESLDCSPAFIQFFVTKRYREQERTRFDGSFVSLE